MIRELVKELKIFERNKVPEEIKVLGVAIYFQFNLQENCEDPISSTRSPTTPSGGG